MPTKQPRSVSISCPPSVICALRASADLAPKAYSFAAAFTPLNRRSFAPTAAFAKAWYEGCRWSIVATAPQSLASETVARTPYALGAQAVWMRALLPSFSDCFFIFLFVWLFLVGTHGWEVLLGDADLGWHIRTGQWILAHHAVPTHDLFSFSKAGAPWFAWEWLSDVVFAVLFGVAGLKGPLLLTGVVIALYSTIMLRHTFWLGANAMIALPLVLLAVGSSTVHFLARPHVFTLLFLAAAMWLIDADRKRNTRWLWTLVPFSVLWVNLHGGVFMFLACLAILTAGCAVEQCWEPSRRAAVRRYALLSVLCAAASFLNPYGIGLHRHIWSYLRSDWIRNNIQEFMAPTFRNEGQLQYEALLILGLVTAGLLLRRRKIVEALWIVFLAHSSLTSLRHAPLFCLVAIPLVAGEITVLWNGLAATLPRRSLVKTLHTLGSDLSGPFRRSSVWIPVMLLIVAVAPISWPSDFPAVAFPGALITRHASQLETARVLTSDQWGDYLIYRYYPRQRVYVDGRSDFYGEELGDEYLHLLQLAPGWQQIFDRRRFDAVLLDPHWPLVQMLRQRSDWRLVEDTGRAVLFLRAQSASLAPGGAQSPALPRTKENPGEG